MNAVKAERKAEDAAFERAEHPFHGPWRWEMPPDPMATAVQEAGGAAIREWGDWWDGEGFLEALDAAGYRVVPK